jgi:hypothetical protein
VETRVPKHCSGEKSGFEQNLEAVADPDHQTIGARKALHLAHDWRKSSNGTRSKMIAVGEPTGQHDSVKGREIS